jgi:hypothetical protein
MPSWTVEYRHDAPDEPHEHGRGADPALAALDPDEVEIGDAALPPAQKRITVLARDRNWVVITAIRSRCENHIPTRAEIFDVAAPAIGLRVPRFAVRVGSGICYDRMAQGQNPLLFEDGAGHQHTT